MAERTEKGQHVRCRAAPPAIGDAGGSSCAGRPSWGSASPCPLPPWLPYVSVGVFCGNGILMRSVIIYLLHTLF